MPTLKNNRRENFSLGVAKGLTATQAYREAGYRGQGHVGEAGASELMRKPEVTARITELQARHAERTAVTVDTIAAQLDEDRQLAFAQGQASAAVAASVAKAKLYGLVVDKAEVETALRKPLREPSNDKEMSMQNWLAKFKPKRLEHGAPTAAPQPEPVIVERHDMSIMEFVKASAARRDQTD